MIDNPEFKWHLEELNKANSALLGISRVMVVNKNFILTMSHAIGYPLPVTSKKGVIGLVARTTGGQVATMISSSVVFLSSLRCSVLARLGGSLRASRSCVRSTNPLNAPFLFGSKDGVSFTSNTGETL